LTVYSATKLLGSATWAVKPPLSSAVTWSDCDHVLPIVSLVDTVTLSPAGQPAPVIVTVEPGA
jgi:hypothetical protein